jgi:hypothetical protein
MGLNQAACLKNFLSKLHDDEISCLACLSLHKLVVVASLWRQTHQLLILSSSCVAPLTFIITTCPTTSRLLEDDPDAAKPSCFAASRSSS